MVGLKLLFIFLAITHSLLTVFKSKNWSNYWLYGLEV